MTIPEFLEHLKTNYDIFKLPECKGWISVDQEKSNPPRMGGAGPSDSGSYRTIRVYDGEVLCMTYLGVHYNNLDWESYPDHGYPWDHEYVPKSAPANVAFKMLDDDDWDDQIRVDLYILFL